MDSWSVFDFGNPDLDFRKKRTLIRLTYGLMRIGWIWIVTSYKKDGSFEKKSSRILAISQFK